ncbi:MAG: hypothetical protein A2275_04120 [Bacteroidetes bacterium RIFOXYA12_FULL_35_11]|nr:MAG: hypothetical protein A2X01_10260 [Bacteroidetes bacterium GWF2_35_48]OFY81006.1 MAG: hypothetical protein A2275_04120 [Bacteroidetes bacterium RIFOXYA12_FULL_35_11]OFY94184.1 MAG: hypothetical protein A2491_03815 [Bacteroidetes bacterium RIFOXYC12_FULL_35_7]HBX49970.1 hypothetical protein [Bacteroidales bacterium]
MKQLFLTLLLLHISIILFSQEQKFNIYAGVGFGIYGGSTNDPNDKDTTSVDAGCGIIHLSADYMIKENIYSGLMFERNGFLTDTGSTDHAFSINIAWTASYKLHGEKNSLVISIMPGYSLIKYQNGSSGNFVEGNGIVFQAAIQWDHFYTKHIGMFIQPAFASYSYTKLTDESGNISKNANGDYFKLNLYGMNLKIGLVVKF